MKVLCEEVMINIWRPVRRLQLTNEQNALILPQMTNYLEKYKPNMEFKKYKTRVLKRGNKQWNVGESVGPVVCVESLYTLLRIAAHENLEVFKVDIRSTIMCMPMVDDVKHNWVKLDKYIVETLCELEPGKYEPSIESDGTLAVEMTAISYDC